MAQTAVKLFFDSRHDGLESELNRWLREASGKLVITGISMDSNKYGHCLAVMYERTGDAGRFYRAHLFYNSGHGRLEDAANEGLMAAQAQWGKFVAVGSNEYGHCLCVLEEQQADRL